MVQKISILKGNPQITRSSKDNVGNLKYEIKYVGNHSDPVKV